MRLCVRAKQKYPFRRKRIFLLLVGSVLFVALKDSVDSLLVSFLVLCKEAYNRNYDKGYCHGGNTHLGGF